MSRNDPLPDAVPPLPLPVSEPQVLQPMPPDMLPQAQLRRLGGAPGAPVVRHDLATLELYMRQVLFNQWLILQLAQVTAPTGGLLKGQVEAALNATEDLLGGKP